jgi:hypothetical protein
MWYVGLLSNHNFIEQYAVCESLAANVVGTRGTILYRCLRLPPPHTVIVMTVGYIALSYPLMRKHNNTGKCLFLFNFGLVHPVVFS